jgi:hypothetical protein
MRSSVSPTISNIHKEHFFLNWPQHKPSLWLCYVHNTFVVYPHGPEQLQNVLSQLNSSRPSNQFTMEQSGSEIHFLDFLSSGKRQQKPPKSTENPLALAAIWTYKFNHPLHVKRGFIRCLHNRTSSVCQEQDLFNETSSLRHDLQPNSYPQWLGY